MLTYLCISALLRLQNQSSESKDQHLHQNPRERRGTGVRGDRPEGGRHHGQARDSVRCRAFFPHRRSRNKVAPTNSVPCHPGQTTIQVRVPYRMVGLVVGPKGTTIKRIQQQTHTYIVTPSRDKDPVFEVTGMPENVDRAREEIEAHIAMRTAGSVDTIVDDDDFHYNGTDVGFESGSHRAWLFSGGVSNVHSNAAAIATTAPARSEATLASPTTAGKAAQWRISVPAAAEARSGSAIPSCLWDPKILRDTTG